MSVFEQCEEYCFRSPPNATLRGTGEWFPPWKVVPDYGHRIECDPYFNSKGLECMCSIGGFEPVARFPPALFVGCYQILTCLECPFGLAITVKSQGGYSLGSLRHTSSDRGALGIQT